jgi:outer membrane protein assembly factor BamA
LQRDGDVVGTDGYTRLLFPALASDNYFVSIRHRNHLGTMTLASITLNKHEHEVDFTLGTTATYGSNARMSVPFGRYVLWAGNTMRDNLLKYTGSSNDRDPILSAIGGVIPTNTVTGYLQTDVTMDGTVKYTGTANDRDPILSNIGGMVPTTTRTEQLP